MSSESGRFGLVGTNGAKSEVFRRAKMRPGGTATTAGRSPEPPFCSKHFDHSVLVAVEIEKNGLRTVWTFGRLLRELDTKEAYYRCNGRHDTRGVYGERGQRCSSKDVQGVWQQAVWQEVEGMVRQPQRALEQLRQRLIEERAETPGRIVARPGRILKENFGAVIGDQA